MSDPPDPKTSPPERDTLTPTSDSALEHARAERLHALDHKANDKLDELLRLQKEQMGRHDNDTRTTMQKLVQGLLWSFNDRAGRKFLLTLIAAISSLTTALGTTYALMTGRLPGSPQHPIQYLPPPPPEADHHVSPIPRASGGLPDRPADSEPPAAPKAPAP